MRPSLPALAALLFACSGASALEVSTGFLIGPRHDPRSIYVRDQPGSAWRKCNAGRASNPLSFVRVFLQSEEANSFRSDGSLEPEAFAKLDRLLRERAAEAVAVELVLFHPAQDHNFDSPESLERAVDLATDWLIDRDHRHVMLNPGGDWTAAGWDFDSYVPQHATQFAQRIRDRFQARKTDYLLPVAVSLASRLTPSSSLVQEADVLIVSGEAAASDPKSIERPMLVLAEGNAGCGAASQRFAGCVVAGSAVVK
jgi:hypothetical protein